MDELTLGVAASLAWMIPFVVSFLKQRAFPASVNMLLAAGAAFGIATIGVLVSGEVDFSNGIQDVDVFLGAAGLAFMESQVVYRLIIKGTVTGERINEAITTFPRKPVEAIPLGESPGLEPDPSIYRTFTVDDEPAEDAPPDGDSEL